MTPEREDTCGNRKQITFDLSQAALKQFYPHSAMTSNPTFYKKAYSDISRFMKRNGFEHRQFSVYISKEKLTEAKVITLIDELAYQMPWLSHCVNQIDVTNIGSQHSLLKALETSTALQIESPKIDSSIEEPSQLIKLSMKDRFEAAAKESARREAAREGVPAKEDISKDPERTK